MGILLIISRVNEMAWRQKKNVIRKVIWLWNLWQFEQSSDSHKYTQGNTLNNTHTHKPFNFFRLQPFIC